ncbi:HNH endonuclease [Halosegnis marinus]|uniref:HNH endonuclease n=1 Tax=Halosegnis marinus TaxID=3034023 RepID=A0ABD5ZSW1_9EURY|nr:hypothetical protein [Halosegnis sp. DT85]
MADPDPCALCGRYGDALPMERHHLVPEHRKESPVVTVCSPCHDQLHALFTNEELIEEYHTAERLRAADRMADYLDWIRGTDKTSIEVRTSDRVRRER